MKLNLSQRVASLISDYEESGKPLSILSASHGLQRGQFYNTLKVEPELQTRYETARKTFKELRRAETVEKLESQLLKHASGRGVKRITRRTYNSADELIETVETEITGNIDLRGLLFLLERYSPKAENKDEIIEVSFKPFSND